MPWSQGGDPWSIWQGEKQIDMRHLNWQEQKPHIPNSGRQDVPAQNTNRTGSERGHWDSRLGTKAQLFLSLGRHCHCKHYFPTQVWCVLTALPTASKNGSYKRLPLRYVKWPETHLRIPCWRSSTLELNLLLFWDIKGEKNRYLCFLLCCLSSFGIK